MQTPAQKQELDAELATLNAEVKAAIAKRRAWMDAHMADYARFQIGETVYDLNTGERLGKVVELYRYHAGRNPEYDDQMAIEYRFQDGPRGIIDNTSRHAGGLSIGTAETLAQLRESQARVARLRRPDGGIDWAKVFPATPEQGA